MKLVGLMSGTSLDGIDACLLEVEGEDPLALDWTLRAFRTRPYTADERALLRRGIEDGTAEVLCRLHGELGELLADAVLDLLAGAGVEPREIAAVGSHGQTLWHQPPGRGDAQGRGFTLQLGDPATVAERTGIDVVSDLRSRDVAAGGHGAPLVPWADRVLLSRPGRARVLQNLGGMANLAWIPPAGSADPVVAFDTGPGCALLDLAAGLATGGRLTFDVDGGLASRGTVDEALLARLLSDPFFQETPPRSTGREHFSAALVEALARERGLVHGVEDGWPDLLTTLTALTVRSVEGSIRRWLPPRRVDEVVLAGGGALNPVLVGGIRDALAPLPVLTGEESLGVDPDAKEAAAFALLAWAHLKGLPGNVPEATGARGLRVLGSLTPGRRAGGAGHPEGAAPE